MVAATREQSHFVELPPVSSTLSSTDLWRLSEFLFANTLYEMRVFPSILSVIGSPRGSVNTNHVVEGFFYMCWSESFRFFIYKYILPLVWYNVGKSLRTDSSLKQYFGRSHNSLKHFLPFLEHISPSVIELCCNVTSRKQNINLTITIMECYRIYFQYTQQ